jgi:esterase/lipase superfamily enzyme
MRREYVKWHSAALDREMELLLFGESGFPLLVFPTSLGRFFDYEDHGMVQALAPRVDRGELQIFCMDSVDAESWYNHAAPPAERVRRHELYDDYLTREAVPFVRGRNQSPQLWATGCSLGGYHAMNFALRHPDLVTYAVSLSGPFELPRRYLNGYYDPSVYFHCPPHFLPDLSDDWYLSRYRANYYVLAVGESDSLLDENARLAGILENKGVPRLLDIWSGWCHDWPWWREMAAKFFL